MLFGLLTLILIAANSDYPLDQDMKNVCDIDGVNFETISKVVKVGNTYTYMYSVKNKSKNPLKFKWSIISRAMQYGADIGLLYDIPPGEHINFVLNHPDPPVYSYGPVSAYSAMSKAEFEKMRGQLPDIPKGVKMSLPSKNFMLEYSANNMSGPLPKSYVKKAE